MHGLYGKELPREMAPLACGGSNNQDGNGESCVTFGRIPGVADAFAVGDSKNTDATPLRFFGDELRAIGIDTNQIA